MRSNLFTFLSDRLRSADNVWMKMDASDSSLLRDYVNGKGSGSFQALVTRYQDLVFSTARRGTGDRGLAEEVTQDVFVHLSNQARILLGHPNLAGWIYKTTLKKAGNRMRSEKRRRVREQAYERGAGKEQRANLDSPDCLALMDEALAGLREVDREALILRFFQDLEFHAVGQAQGVSAEAARKRVQRSLEKLRALFQKRGVVFPTAAGVGAVLAAATQPAPAGICAALTVSSVAPPVTTTFLNLIMTMNKTKIAALAIIAVAIPVGIHQATQKEPNSDSVDQKPPPIENSSGKAQVDRRPAGSQTKDLSVKVDSGQIPSSPAPPDPMMDMLLKRVEASHGRLLKDLGLKLELSEQQKSQLEEVLQERRDRLIALLTDENEAGGLADSEDGMRQIGALIRGAGLRESISGFLTDQQMVGYDDFLQADFDRQVESRALKELARITPVLDLSGEQKDQVLEVMYDSAEAKVEEEQDFRAFMSMWSGQHPSEVDVTNIALARVFMAAESEGEIGSEKFQRDLVRVESQRIEQEVSRLKPILSEEQMVRYREHLDQTGLHSLIKSRTGQ